MGFKIKGLKKVFKNPTHSKAFKLIDPTAHYGNKVRKKLGLTGHRLKRLAREIKTGMLSGSSLNSANSVGAVIPPQVGSNRSVTSMY